MTSKRVGRRVPNSHFRIQLQSKGKALDSHSDSTSSNMETMTPACPLLKSATGTNEHPSYPYPHLRRQIQNGVNLIATGHQLPNYLDSRSPFFWDREKYCKMTNSAGSQWIHSQLLSVTDESASARALVSLR